MNVLTFLIILTPPNEEHEFDIHCIRTKLASHFSVYNKTEINFIA